MYERVGEKTMRTIARGLVFGQSYNRGSGCSTAAKGRVDS
jgi:hypothetical protein